MFCNKVFTQHLDILRQKPTTEEILKYSLHLLEEFGSFEYTRQTLRMLKNEAEEEMNKFEENPYILQLFEDIFIKLKID
jgi:geranylgeranyl diphosphate synthase type 3